MHKIAAKIHNDEKKRKKMSLKYLRGLLDYNEGKHERANLRFNKLADEHHEAAYMAVICSMKLGKHDNATIYMDRYVKHIKSWRESDEKDDAIERVKKLREMLDVGRVFG